MNPVELIQKRLIESNTVRMMVAEQCSANIAQAALLISQAFRNEKKLLLCGNGGSAADCQHLAAEFVSRLTIKVQRRALPAIALTTDTSFLTAYSNDCGYEGVFERQVEALGQAGDVLLGISTSGGSKNVVRAMELGRSKGLSCIALIGEGGVMRSFADVTIAVPSKHTQYIQECHLSIEHLLCELVERELFSDAYKENV
ncbi:MAG: SIS domain-containing protein [Proteobacteria bacterium]|nr:SIS domain-containing protein [Pseudomonadota bacterium]